jgi:hypothetical protein
VLGQKRYARTPRLITNGDEPALHFREDTDRRGNYAMNTNPDLSKHLKTKRNPKNNPTGNI